MLERSLFGAFGGTPPEAAVLLGVGTGTPLASRVMPDAATWMTCARSIRVSASSLRRSVFSARPSRICFSRSASCFMMFPSLSLMPALSVGDRP